MATPASLGCGESLIISRILTEMRTIQNDMARLRKEIKKVQDKVADVERVLNFAEHHIHSSVETMRILDAAQQPPPPSAAILGEPMYINVDWSID
jgi:phage shock protein A